MITDELENELRNLFARSAAEIVVPEHARKRLLQRDYHPKTGNRGWVVGILVAAAVAAGIAVPLATGEGSQPAEAGPVIRFASYTFRMPTGYKLTAAASAPCRASVVFLSPSPARSAQNASGEAGMKAAASASGGCIAAVLAPPYTPTAGVSDPEAPAAAHPVQVGHYHGRIFHSSMVRAKTGINRNARHGITRGWQNVTDLYVQLPAGDGKMRDLVIGATGLSDSTLIKIAARGLSS